MWDKISLDEILKSINSQTNNTSSGNDAFTAKFYQDFSNELAAVLLNVYDSWGKLGNMGVTSRTRTISVISIICTIKIAYTNIQSKIKTNGLLSDPFTLMKEFPVVSTLNTVIHYCRWGTCQFQW